MNVYDAEVALAEQIKNSTSINYHLHAEAAEDSELSKIKELADTVSLSSIIDKDLFYHRAILVTTNWNKNDDVLLPMEVWAARKSPVHKPTNFDHNSSRIVGHITDNWAIDAQGKEISDDLDMEKLPSKYHILTGAVIYRKFHNDEEYQERVARLIEEIETGQKYVSMECSFEDFDYALEYNGKVDIIKRNKDTAFLTKHLRIFGGEGRYEGYKLGRVLRNISFIGKAYTSKPANPDSIILLNPNQIELSTASTIEKPEEIMEKIKEFKKNGVILSSEADLHGEKLMSEILQDQNKELKEHNSALAQEVKELQKKLAEADVQNYEKAVVNLNEELDSLKKELASANESNTDLTKELTQAKEVAAQLNETVAKLNEEVNKTQAEKAFASRVSLLVENKIDKTVAEEKVKLFVDLSDEQFEAVANELIEAKKSVAKNVDPKDADLDNSTADASDTTVASDTDSTDEAEEENKAFAALVERVAESLNQPIKK